jgi:cyanophycin synthetase
VVGLDIAGVDLVAQDISRPLAEQRGAIVEVNAGPGLLMHLKPADGSPRPVGRAIVDHLFSGEDDGRIPLVGVSGTRDTTPVAQIVAHMLRLAGKRVGLACSTGMYLGRRHIERGNRADWMTGRRLLQNRLVDAAVLENGPDMIANEGLAYDRCQVGIVTHIDADCALPGNYIETPEQMYRLLRTQIDVVLEGGAAVLNAHDPLTVDMADLCDGEIIYFASDASLPVIAAHCAAGGRAILFVDGAIVIAKGASLDTIVTLEPNPANLANPGDANGIWRGDIAIECLLAAVGAACALNLRSDLIATAINTFVPDYGSPAAAPAQPVARRKPAAKKQAAAKPAVAKPAAAKPAAARPAATRPTPAPLRGARRNSRKTA